MRSKMEGENNPMWKGNDVGLIALHEWIGNRKPKPKFCEKCKKNKPYDLANISGEYKRNINDFEWLCRSCHMKKDGRINNLCRNEKRKHKGNLIYCSKCQKFKLKEEFYKNKHREDGFKLLCKKCEKESRQKKGRD